MKQFKFILSAVVLNFGLIKLCYGDSIHNSLTEFFYYAPAKDTGEKEKYSMRSLMKLESQPALVEVNVSSSIFSMSEMLDSFEMNSYVGNPTFANIGGNFSLTGFKSMQSSSVPDYMSFPTTFYNPTTSEWLGNKNYYYFTKSESVSGISVEEHPDRRIENKKYRVPVAALSSMIGKTVYFSNPQVLDTYTSLENVGSLETVARFSFSEFGNYPINSYGENCQSMDIYIHHFEKLPGSSLKPVYQRLMLNKSKATPIYFDDYIKRIMKLYPVIKAKILYAGNSDEKVCLVGAQLEEIKIYHSFK